MSTLNKRYTKLIEIDPDTGTPTGREKDNLPGDPDYIPPFYSPDCVPSTTTTTSTTSTTTSTTTRAPETLAVILNNMMGDTRVLGGYVSAPAFLYWNSPNFVMARYTNYIVASGTLQDAITEFSITNRNAFPITVEILYQMSSDPIMTLDSFALAPFDTNVGTYSTPFNNMGLGNTMIVKVTS